MRKANVFPEPVFAAPNKHAAGFAEPPRKELCREGCWEAEARSTSLFVLSFSSTLILTWTKSAVHSRPVIGFASRATDNFLASSFYFRLFLFLFPLALAFAFAFAHFEFRVCARICISISTRDARY
jgi:hypothetical protein